MGLKVNNLPTINILKDGTEYKLTVLVDFDGKGNFQTEVYINDTFERSATYLQPKSKKSKVCGFKKNTNHVYCEDKIIKYYQSKKFSFKHGIYATNMFDITLRSKWNLSEVRGEIKTPQKSSSVEINKEDLLKELDLAIQ